MEKRIQTFNEFYTFYLKEHSNKTCRLLHIIGTTFVFASFLTAILYLDPLWLLLAPIFGYSFAWIGHFFFEKNKPATFKYPLWSLQSDFKMYFDFMSGKISLDSKKDTL